MADSHIPCTICSHARRDEINTALLARVGVREVTRRYQLDKSTVSRHQRLHLLPRLTAAESAAPARVQAIEDNEAHLNVMTAMRDLHRRTLALLNKAEESGDIHVALRAVREARGNLEMLGRLDGSLDGPVAPTSGNVQVVIQYVDKAIIAAGSTPPMLTDGE
jgi:hypothetical protein